MNAVLAEQVTKASEVSLGFLQLVSKVKPKGQSSI